MNHLDQLKQWASGYSYVWIGNLNCTFGTPNPITGCYSLHGRYIAFNTRKERDKFIQNYTGHGSCLPCSVNTGRKYSLGSTLESYYMELNEAGYDA